MQGDPSPHCLHTVFGVHINSSRAPINAACPGHYTIEYSNYVFLCPYLGFLCPYLPLHTSSPASKYKMMNQWWDNAGPALQTLDQNYNIIGSTSRVRWASPVVCKQ